MLFEGCGDEGRFSEEEAVELGGGEQARADSCMRDPPVEQESKRRTGLVDPVEPQVEPWESFSKWHELREPQSACAR
jgi:hypothetical protein